MKSPVLGLALSTVALGAASAYLWVQLDAQRVQSEKFEHLNEELNTRLAELDQRRAEAVQRHRGAPPLFEQVVVNAPPAGEPPPPGDEALRMGPNRTMRNAPEMPAAMLKMMRYNMRAQNKRMYFDLQSKLGLTDEQTSAMFDMLAEQQAQGFREARNQNPDEAQAYWQAQQAKNKSDIANLLGTAKATEFAEYQKTMPSRSELMMISQQLEGIEAPMNEDQRSRMLDVLVEERERIPEPTFVQGMEQEAVAKSYSEWQSDYEKRVADRARSILSTEQISTYNEYQEWQREMREQYAVRGPASPGGRMRVGGPATFMAVPASSASNEK